ncbi:MAG: DUF86 domain-containing protein [Eubacterium sp.]|nr:DUF86 domain-containing protein [Eubacterium sp.]
MRVRDLDVIKHMKGYCTDIMNTVERFGDDSNIFENDLDFRNSVCMSLLQIGELTVHLSDEFRGSTKEEIYWPAIKGMRNVFAHGYGAIDYDRVWETVKEDIPMLLSFCQKKIETSQTTELEGN